MRSIGQLLSSPWLLCPLLFLLILIGSLVDFPPLRQLELPIYDRLAELRTTSLNQQVVLLTIDQQSRAMLGDQIVSRSGLARILSKLRELGVKRTALLTPQSFDADPAVDRLLLARLTELHPLLTVEQMVKDTAKTGLADGSLLPQPPPLPDPRQLLLTLRNPLADYRFGQPAPQSFLPPAATFQSARLAVGHLQFNPDPDGSIRHHQLFVPVRDKLLPSVPLLLALSASGRGLSDLQLPPRELAGVMQSGRWRFPVDHDYRILLNLSGPDRPYLQYSVAQLLSGELDTRNLAEKLVLIGPTGSFGDRHRLAGGGAVNSSELAALATASLLATAPLQRPAWAWQVESLVLLYFLVLLLLLLPRLSIRVGLLSLVLFLGSWLLAAGVSLVFFGVWLQIVPALLLCLLGTLLIRWNLGLRARSASQLLSNRQLALSFQEQGLLDQALDKFLQFPPKDKASKEMLYNLGLDFERKRMPHKALTAYRHLLGSGRFRDARERIQQLQDEDRTEIIPKRDATLVLDRPGEKPTLGRYRIERELGQGAMGTVYLGIDPKINRQVAIKTLDYQQIDPAQLKLVKERFFREAEAAGRLNHQHIVTIYDVGEEQDLAYLAMELLDGKPLSDYCQANRLLPLDRVVRLIAQVARALDYAHRQEVIHRDIKPANIIVLKNWQAKVVDFGVARIVSSPQTETGAILGTPSYMSPEQVSGKKIDGRSDLFSLGVVMYELLSGLKPFQGDSMGALMYNISKCNYRSMTELRPELPPTCQYILDRLLKKGTSRRYKNAALLAEALDRLQQELEG